jgi:hypothetical protein
MGMKEGRFKLTNIETPSPKKRKIKRSDLKVAVYHPFHLGFRDTIFELPASQYDLSYPYQQVFLENSAFGLRKSIGTFYEILNGGIYGGKSMHNSKGFDSSDNGDAFRPDIIGEGVIGEVKSVCGKESLKLPDFQIDNYLFQQLDFMFKEDIEFYFANYKYMVDNPLNYLDQFREHAQEELVRLFSYGTMFSLVLPLSIIAEMHNPNHTSEHKQRYDKKKYDPITRIYHNGLLKFLEKPEEAIKEYGLHPKDYAFERVLSPSEMTINGLRINQFPILIVKDKDVYTWKQHAKVKYKDRIDSFRENGLTRREYREGFGELVLKEREASLKINFENPNQGVLFTPNGDLYGGDGSGVLPEKPEDDVPF